jgi:hypothetical protein
MTRFIVDKSKLSVWHYHPDVHQTIGVPTHPIKRGESNYYEHKKKGGLFGKERKKPRPES